MINVANLVDQKIQNLIHKISLEKDIPAEEIRVILKLDKTTGKTNAWASRTNGEVIRVISLKEV